MFCGIASALYAREKSGRGASVDVAMFDATLAFLEHGVMEYVAYGKPLHRMGNRHPFAAPFDTFAASDEDLVVCAGNDHLFAQLCNAIGRPDLITDERFMSNPRRLENHAALKDELEAALKRRPASHWLEAIQEAGVPVAPLLNVAQAVEHPQTRARNMLIEAGGVRMVGNPIKISGYEDPPTRVGAPTLDQHGDALRREFGA
jgi:CoA:oxalate CoA-transferase